MSGNDPELEFIVKMQDQASANAEKLLRTLRQLDKTFTSKVTVSVTAKEAMNQLEKVNKVAGSIPNKITIKVIADTKDAKTKINALEKELKTLAATPHVINITAHTKIDKAAIEKSIRDAIPEKIQTRVTPATLTPAAVPPPGQTSKTVAANLSDVDKAKLEAQRAYLANLAREEAIKNTAFINEIKGIDKIYSQKMKLIKLDKGRENIQKRYMGYEEALNKLHAQQAAVKARDNLTDAQKAKYAETLHDIQQKLVLGQLAESKAMKYNMDGYAKQVVYANALQKVSEQIVEKESALATLTEKKKSTSIFATKEDVKVIDNVLAKIKTFPTEIKTKINFESFLKFLSTIELLTRRLMTLSLVVGGIGFAGMGLAMGLIAKKSADLNSNFELFQTQLRTTIGSLAAAKQEMAEIVEFAKETPYQIEEVTQAAVKLRAYYMDPDKWLRPLGDMAAAFGLSIENAVEAAADAIRGEFRRIRQYGFIFRVEDFRKGGKYAGQTYAEAVLKAIESRFKGGMELQAQTMKGIISNIKDTFTISLTKAGEPFYIQMKQMAQDTLDWLNKMSSSGQFDEIVGKLNDTAIGVIKAVRGSIDYMSKNWGPALKTIFTSAMSVVSQLADFMGQLAGGPGAKLTRMFLDIAAVIAQVADKAAVLFKIWISYKIIVAIFNKLAFTTAAMTKALDAQSTAYERFAVKLGFVGKRLLWLIGIYTILNAINSKIDYSRGISSLSESLGSIKAPPETLKTYFEDLSDKINVPRNTLVDAAQTAVSFGDKWQVVLETAASVADDLGMSVKDATALVGELGEKSGLTTEEIKSLANSLIVAKQVIEDTGLEFSGIMSDILTYPDLLQTLSHGFDSMIAIIEEATKAGISYREVFESLAMLKNPSEEMLMNMDPNMIIDRTLKDTQNLGKVLQSLGVTGAESFTNIDRIAEQLGDTVETRARRIMDSGAILISTMEEYYQSLDKTQEEIDSMKSSPDIFRLVQEAVRDLREEVETLTTRQQELQEAQSEYTTQLEYIQKQTAYWNIEMQKINLEESKWQKQLDAVNTNLSVLQDKLSELNALEPTGFKAYTDQTFALTQAINGINLDVAKEQLAMLSGDILEQSKLVNQLNANYKAADAALDPLRKQVQSLRDDFDAVTKSMTDAQNKLNELTNVRFEGDTDYQRQMHNIEKQRLTYQKSLQEAQSKVASFGEWGHDTDAYKQAAAEVDVIQAKLNELDDLEERLRLERELAISDAQFEIGLLADTRPETAIADALNQARQAREAYEAARPTAEALAAEVQAAEDNLATQEKIVQAKKDAYEVANNELTLMQTAHQLAIDNLSLEQQRLSTLQEILNTQWDINTAGFYQTRTELTNPVTEGNPEDILQNIREVNAAIADARSQVAFWEGVLQTYSERKSELEISIAQNAIDQSVLQMQIDAVSAELDTIETKLADDEGRIKDLVANVDAIISKLDESLFISGDQTITERMFGEDIAGDIAKMQTYRDTLAEIVALQGQVTGAETGGSEVGTWLENHPLVTGGAVLAGTIGAGVLGKKYGARVLGKVGNVKIPGTGGQTIGTYGEANLEKYLAQNRAALAEQNQRMLKQIEELKLKNPAAGTRAEELWQTQYGKLSKAQELEELIKRDPAFAKQLGVTKATVKEARGAPSTIKEILGWGTLGVFGAGNVKELTGNLTSGGGNIWERFTRNMYSIMKTGNDVNAAVKGLSDASEIANRAGTRITGKVEGNILGRIKGSISSKLGGLRKSGAVTAGGLGLGGGMLSAGLLGALFGGLTGGAGGAAEGALQGGAYMGMMGASQSVLTKLLGSAAGKAVPILGWAGMAGDIVSILEGLTGTTTEEAMTKVTSPLVGKTLGKDIGQTVGGVTETLKNISGVLGGLTGGLVGIVKGIFTGDWSYLKDSMSGLLDNLKLIPENILKTLGGAISTIGDTGIKILGALTWPFQQLWGWLTDNFAPAAWIDEHILQPFLGWLGSTWAGIKDFLSDPFNKAKDFLFGEDGIKSWPGKIGGFLQGAIDWVSDKWGWLGDAISGPFKDAWGWISEHVSSWGDSIGGWLQKVPDWFSDTWNTITDKVKQPFITAWNWLSDTENGLASWPDKIGGWISDIPNKIGDALGSIKDAGKRIVISIGDGLKEGWDFISNLPGVKQVVGLIDTVGNAVGGFLGDIGQRLGITKSHEGEIIYGPKTKEVLRVVRGQEAIIPLKNGTIPIELPEIQYRAIDYSMKEKIDYRMKERELLSNIMKEIVLSSGTIFEKGNRVTPVLDSILLTTKQMQAKDEAINARLQAIINNAKNTTTAVSPTYTIPPTTNGTKQTTNITNLTVSEGAFTFIVRDDDDIEEIKKAILDLRKGQIKLGDNPFNYTPGY